MNMKAVVLSFSLCFFHSAPQADLYRVISPFDLDKNEMAVVLDNNTGWGIFFVNFHGFMTAITAQLTKEDNKISVTIPCLGFWFTAEIIERLTALPVLFKPERWAF